MTKIWLFPTQIFIDKNLDKSTQLLIYFINTVVLFLILTKPEFFLSFSKIVGHYYCYYIYTCSIM